MTIQPPQPKRGIEVYHYLHNLWQWLCVNNVVGGDYVFVRQSGQGKTLQVSALLLDNLKYKDFEFGISSYDHRNHTVRINGGHVVGFGSSIIVPSRTVTVAAGTIATPSYVYVSGAVHTLTGTIQTATIGTYPYHDNTTWRMALVALYYDDISKRINIVPGGISHVGMIDLRSFYGP